MIGLAIIADDLTGALDAAAPFAAPHSGVVVATNPDAIAQAHAARPAVLAVSTRSRELTPDDARRAVERVLAALPEGVRQFKKIDSRLKGNIATELSAFGERPLLVAPGIPEFGRFVRNGALEGFGVAKPMPVRGALGACSARATVPDTVFEKDLDIALEETSDNTLLVGARGLAMALARRMGVTRISGPPILPHPLCIAVGSLDPITLEQIADLRKALPTTLHVPAPSGIGPAPPTHSLPPVTVIQATTGAETPPGKVAKNLATTVKAWTENARSMVLTGGATAEACLDALGIETLTVSGELIPGMPICTASEKTIMTKSGGFGDPDALTRIAGVNQRAEV